MSPTSSSGRGVSTAWPARTNKATKEELCDDFFAAASQASQATDFIIDRYEQEVGHPAAGKEIVQKLDMPEKTEQEDRADRSLSHKKETARDASAHMQGDRAKGLLH